MVELPGGDRRLMAVWRMGAGDGCNEQLFNFSYCLAIGGYMPYWKAYSSSEGLSWSAPERISKVSHLDALMMRRARHLLATAPQ
eukprot:COSAG01_NODE_4249_length_5207_cov_3.508319_5_plen_84_part_00